MSDAKLKTLIGSFSLLLLAWHFLCSALWAQEPLRVEDGFTSLSTQDYIEFYEDKTQSQNFQNIGLKEFQKNPKHKLNWGIVAYPVWLKLFIKDTRRSREPLVLVFDYPLLDEVSFVICSSDQPQMQVCPEMSQVQQGGRMRPELRHSQAAASDELVIHQDPALPSIRYHSVWIKVQQTAGSLQVPSKLLSQSELLKVQRQEVLLSGLYFGGLLVLIIYNLFVCISLRSFKYFCYVFYMSAYLCFQFFASGFGYGVLGSSLAPWLGGKIIPAGILMFGHSALLFALIFLNIRSHSRLLFWISLSFITIGQLTMVCSPWLGNQLFYKIVVSFITPIWIGLEFTCGFVALRSPQYRRAAILYLISWSAFVSGSFLIMLRIVGVLPINFLTVYGQQIGSWLEGVLMSFAMADVINQLRFQTDRQAKDLKESNAQLKIAESQLRLELKTRNMLVSNLSHRTNNPLNYIAISSQFVARTLTEQKQMILSLLSDDEGEDDPEKLRLRSQFRTQFTDLEQAMEQLELGLAHAVQSIADIRNISGIDGFSMSEFSLASLVKKLRERCDAATGTPLPLLEFQVEEGLNETLTGNITLLSLAFEMIFTRAIKQNEKMLAKIRLTHSQDGQATLSFHMPFVNFHESVEFDEEAEYIRYLLQAYKIDLRFPTPETCVVELKRESDMSL